MSMQLTLTFSDAFIHRAQLLAAHLGCDLTEIVTRAALLSLPSLEAGTSTDLEMLTDSQMLALSRLQMDPTLDARLSTFPRRAWERKRALRAIQAQRQLPRRAWEPEFWIYRE